MNNFKTALQNVLNDMRHGVDEDLCCAVYYDAICEDNAIVMFMEYHAYGTMHAVMKDLNLRLSDKLGHPVSLCHNHPTDENVLIHGSANDSSVYYSDECCKRDIIMSCKGFLNSDRANYRPELQSIWLAAECLAEGLNKTPEYVLQTLDWDQDPQAQLIKLLIDYHK